jgi:hypothetical protein
MKTLFAIALLGLLAAAFFWERNAMDGLRAQNESLRAEKLEAGQLADENRELPGLRAAAGPTQRSDHTELLRLRNEVRRLRAQQQEAEKLRAANQRVAEEIKSGKFTPRRLADMEGAVPREKWAFAGFATPEATAQSFFAGLASGEPEQFLNCLTPNLAAKMRAEMVQDPQRKQEEFKKAFAQMANLSAFRIVQQKPRSPDTVLLEIQVTVDGERMPMPLQRVGNEWKIDLDAQTEPE